MEPVGAFPDGEWDFFGRMFASEEHDYSSSPQFVGQNSILIGENDGALNNIENHECMFYSFDHHSQNNSNSHYFFSQENSYTSGDHDTRVFINANPDHSNYYFSNLDYNNNVLANSTSSISMDEENFASYVPSLNGIVMEENVNLNEEAGCDHHILLEKSQIMEPIVFPTKQLQMQPKRKLDVLEVEVPPEDKINNKSENQKKKPRVDGQGCMKNVRSKKNQKVGTIKGEEAEETNNITGSNGHSSSSNISGDDDINASQENSRGATSESKSALNSNGKARASRGSATDPQSLYARKRRERINERLRILQNLVPNGTKVDISTMLEEAVNYVKFLQLQIKLLSSDDLWMYAPLAYTGLDIGLNLNIQSSPLL